MLPLIRERVSVVDGPYSLSVIRISCNCSDLLASALWILPMGCLLEFLMPVFCKLVEI